MFRSGALRRILLVVVALAVAGYCTLQLKAHLETKRPHENVLVARQDIAPYAVITSADLGYASLPVGSRMPDSLQDPREVIGRVATAAIYRGEQILPQKLGQTPLVLGPDERALAVPVDAVRAVGMTVRPGDMVDVWWLPEKKEGLPGRTGAQVQPPQAALVARGATVLDVVTKDGAQGGSTSPEERRPVSVGSTGSVAVLKVKEGEVQALVTAVGNGTVYLARRR